MLITEDPGSQVGGDENKDELSLWKAFSQETTWHGIKQIAEEDTVSSRK